MDKARMVQATVSNTLDINTPYIQQALSAKDGVMDHDLSDYLVGVQTLGVSDSGAGLGVDPDKKDTTFFVHYIK